jgi:MazG family protein
MAMVEDLRLRCPWDRVQTRETLRPYLVEEVHELDQAIASGDSAQIRHEVADLLLHLAWQLVLGKELDEFTPEQVATELVEKMQRRHPQLFDRGPAEKWEQLKSRERNRGVLEGLPATLPDLLMAYRLQERAAGVGFDWPDTSGPAAKVREELAELEAELAMAAPDRERISAEIGDLFFSVVNLARKAGVPPGPALERSSNRFRERFARVEALAAARGIALHSAGLEALDLLWDEAKRQG